MATVVPQKYRIQVFGGELLQGTSEDPLLIACDERFQRTRQSGRQCRKRPGFGSQAIQGNFSGETPLRCMGVGADGGGYVVFENAREPCGDGSRIPAKLVPVLQRFQYRLLHQVGGIHFRPQGTRKVSLCDRQQMGLVRDDEFSEAIDSKLAVGSSTSCLLRPARTLNRNQWHTIAPQSGLPAARNRHGQARGGVCGSTELQIVLLVSNLGTGTLVFREKAVPDCVTLRRVQTALQAS